MKPYVIFDTTGKILRTGTCQDHMIAAQCRRGELAVEGRGRHDTHCVFQGEVMTKEKAISQGWQG